MKKALLFSALALAGCVTAPASQVTGPVVSVVPDAALFRYEGVNGAPPSVREYARGQAISVSGAADADAAREAIFRFCGGTGTFDPNLDTDQMWQDEATGDYRMAGAC